jgi:hypothetical protein
MTLAAVLTSAISLLIVASSACRAPVGDLTAAIAGGPGAQRILERWEALRLPVTPGARSVAARSVRPARARWNPPRDRSRTGTDRQTDFRTLRRGRLLPDVSRELNEDGVPSAGSTWRRKTRRCRGWMASAVRGMLKNPLYTGQQRWNASQYLRDPDTGKDRRRARPESEWRKPR